MNRHNIKFYSALSPISKQTIHAAVNTSGKNFRKEGKNVKDTDEMSTFCKFKTIIFDYAFRFDKERKKGQHCLSQINRPFSSYIMVLGSFTKL